MLPKQRKNLSNIVSIQITNINQIALDNGAVPK